MSEIKPLETVPGSWDIIVTWKPGTTQEQMSETQSFIAAVSDDVNADADQAPECIQSITISRA